MPSPKSTPTEDLVRLAQGGDRSAFDEIAVRSRDRLATWIRQRIGPQLKARIGPDDVLQETFLWAFKGIANFRWSDEESFNHWLVSIANHVLLKEARKGKHVLFKLEHDVAGRGVTPSRLLRREERFDRLEKALMDLRPEHRQVIELARLEGLTVQEIARRLGRSPNATSQLLGRALKKLREKFGDTQSLGLPDRALQPPLQPEGEEHGA